MRSQTYRAVKIATLVAAVPALAVAGFMFYIAGEHNPQQVFHGDAHSSLSAWLLVGATWFVAVFAVLFTIAFLVLRVIFGGMLSSNRALESGHAEEPRAAQRER